jgi:membrane protein
MPCGGTPVPEARRRDMGNWGRIPWASTIRNRLRLLLQASEKFSSDHGFLLSAGIAFTLLICAIPLTLLLLALLGTYLFSDREILFHIREYLKNAFPTLDPRIMANISTIIEDRQIVGILGLAGLAWTSTWVFSSLRAALNVVFRVEKGRGIFRGKAVDFLLVLLAGVLFLMSMVLTSAVAVFQSYASYFPLDLGIVYQLILKYLIPFLATLALFFLVYQIAPNRKIPFRAALKATFFTSVMWEAAKQLFGWYILHLGRFSAVYGSLSTLAVFFLWIYYSAAIFLFGAEIAVLLEEEKE